jgi:ferredoxin-NADP reductase
MRKIVKILMTEFVTHDVKRFVVERPEGYRYIPGQATLISINKLGWARKLREFTFTSLHEDLVLEFTIKRYPKHKGVTDQLHQLEPGDELIVREPFGTIRYKGAGVFIAGGAGITPFIAILRRLKKDGQISGNTLIFSNKTSQDVILEPEFRWMFKDNKENLILTLTRENKVGYEYGRINEEFLKSKIGDFTQNFYVCGPDLFVKDVRKALRNLGAKSSAIVLEM